MQKENNNDNNDPLKSKFEFPGSITHHLPLLSFTVDHMSLKIKPELSNHILADCEQNLKVTALQDLNEIRLDIAEMKIHKVSSSVKVANFETLKDDKLVIKLADPLTKGNAIDISIIYSAGYYCRNGLYSINEPRSGFHFIPIDYSNEQSQAKQAWTQGEALESRYWFPCVDYPQVKFSVEIQVIAPEDYVVISNGCLVSKKRENHTIIWEWMDKNLIPAHLISVVIGKFSEIESRYDAIPLYYYWPNEIKKQDVMLTFSETPQMLEFFENYFYTKFPYEKYSQVTVDNFEFGGMENASCTTLSRSLLHDKKIAVDYKKDILIVSHEVAHQWFGNLVTCKDWSHLWLNEGFATYSELLYWENSRGIEEFHYNIIEYADIYFEEANKLYRRSIVTKVYKHPDELFDAHSYEKAASVIHMLRNYIGDDSFRKSLEIYLKKYAGRSAESNDFIQTIEETSGKSIHIFFDQWIYRKGHPELDIEISLECSNDDDYNKNTNCQLKLKITQTQEGSDVSDDNNAFQFPLDIRLALHDDKQKIERIDTVMVNKKVIEHTFDIPIDVEVEWISIDPEFKILKKVKSIKVINETKGFQLKRLLINQLHNGKTIIERIDAARMLKNLYSEGVVLALQIAIMNDEFYGVSVEAANTIGSFYDNSNYEKSNNAYQALKICLTNTISFKHLRSEIRQSIIKNIGTFERAESISLLEPFVCEMNDKESDFVRSSAATAIGKSSKNLPSNIKNDKIIPLLKKLVEGTTTFQNILATGAIDGLKELSKDNDENIIINIADCLVENTYYDKDYLIRSSATSALGRFLYIKNDKKSSRIDDTIQKLFDQLLNLLKDKRRKVKINACIAFADDESKFASNPNTRVYQALDTLIYVAEHDIDGYVRRRAETSLNVLRRRINEWSSKPQTLELKMREYDKK